ncbi:hypothetical protein, partial [Xanthomonas campestris]
GPRRLSTPTLTETEQIRLFGGIHAAKGPAPVGGQGPVGMIGVLAQAVFDALCSIMVSRLNFGCMLRPPLFR